MKSDSVAFALPFGEMRRREGGPWFAVTLSRAYESNGNWKDVASFRHEDLPIVVKALDMAYDWMWRGQAPGAVGKADVGGGRALNRRGGDMKSVAPGHSCRPTGFDRGDSESCGGSG